METIFKGLFDNGFTQTISVENFLLCLGISLLLGLIMAFTYLWKNTYSKTFLVTLALLPAVVCVIIMMVNGNIGTGVAVAGAFSLVRFRSAPGSAKEILALFSAMATGLIVGMGYLGFGALFTVIMCAVLFLYNLLTSVQRGSECLQKCLRISLPEDLDYTDVFDDLLTEYTKKYELINVKTTNMGSLFRLTYHITLKDPTREKQMIDLLRERNGNLEIMVSRRETQSTDL